MARPCNPSLSFPYRLSALGVSFSSVPVVRGRLVGEEKFHRSRGLGRMCAAFMFSQSRFI